MGSPIWWRAASTPGPRRCGMCAPATGPTGVGEQAGSPLRARKQACPLAAAGLLGSFGMPGIRVGAMNAEAPRGRR